jgi:hypothetical protein
MSSESPLVKNKYQNLISEAIDSRMCLLLILNAWANNNNKRQYELQASTDIGILIQALARSAGQLKLVNAKVKVGQMTPSDASEFVAVAKKRIETAQGHKNAAELGIFAPKFMPPEGGGLEFGYF